MLPSSLTYMAKASSKGCVLRTILYLTLSLILSYRQNYADINLVRSAYTALDAD